MIISLKRKNGHWATNYRVHAGRDYLVLVTDMSLAPKRNAYFLINFYWNETFIIYKLVVNGKIGVSQWFLIWMYESF